MTRRRTITVVGVVAAVIGVAILIITLTPQHVDRNMGGLESLIIRAAQRVPGMKWFDYDWLERIANVLMFAPFAALVTYLAGIRRWWIVLVGCAVLSALIELAQLLFLPDRTASVGDVVSNTVGAAVGIGVVGVVYWARRSRQARPPGGARPPDQ